MKNFSFTMQWQTFQNVQKSSYSIYHFLKRHLECEFLIQSVFLMCETAIPSSFYLLTDGFSINFCPNLDVYFYQFEYTDVRWYYQVSQQQQLLLLLLLLLLIWLLILLLLLPWPPPLLLPLQPPPSPTTHHHYYYYYYHSNRNPLHCEYWENRWRCQIAVVLVYLVLTWLFYNCSSMVFLVLKLFCIKLYSLHL